MISLLLQTVYMYNQCKCGCVDRFYRRDSSDHSSDTDAGPGPAGGFGGGARALGGGRSGGSRGDRGGGGAGGGGQASALRDLRCRTTFYTALGRLLMVELGEDEEKFEQFMMPLTSQ